MANDLARILIIIIRDIYFDVSADYIALPRCLMIGTEQS